MLNDLESPFQIASIIFSEWEVNKSGTITGFITGPDGRLEKKGEAVLRELERIDSLSNVNEHKRRKRVKPENTIGGYVAQKIWKYRHEVINNEPKTHIWRIQ